MTKTKSDMTTAILSFLLIALFVGGFCFGVYVGESLGKLRLWECLETALDNSDLTNLQRIQIAEKIKDANKNK